MLALRRAGGGLAPGKSTYTFGLGEQKGARGSRERGNKGTGLELVLGAPSSITSHLVQGFRLRLTGVLPGGLSGEARTVAPALQ